MSSIRRATQEDAQTILTTIQALAQYEGHPDSVKLTEEDLVRDGFGSVPAFYVFLAEIEEEGEKKVAGMAFYHFAYSTSEGRTLYLEDLFVYPEFRSRGIGVGLMKRCAQEAKDLNCARFHWQALDWNELALNFYERIGASRLNEWVNLRMDREQINSFLSSES